MKTRPMSTSSSDATAGRKQGRIADRSAGGNLRIWTPAVAKESRETVSLPLSVSVSAVLGDEAEEANCQCP